MAKNVDDLPGMKGPGVEQFKDGALTKLAGKLDDLREQRAKITEQITAAEKQAVERMIELKITRYRYADRELILREGADHVRSKQVDGEGEENEEENND